MSGEQEDFYILVWSSEDIKVDGEDIDLMIQRDVPPDVKIKIQDFKSLREMEVTKLKRILDHNPKSSVLIISSSEKAENLHSWKLGFIMGTLYVYSEKGRARIIGFKKGNSFEELDHFLLSKCDTESEIKEEITHLIKTKYKSEIYTYGSRTAGKEEI